MLVEWLRGLDATVVVEFVDRRDEMFGRLVENKGEEYADYALGNFEAEVGRCFSVVDRVELKGGRRVLLVLEPGNVR